MLRLGQLLKALNFQTQTQTKVTQTPVQTQKTTQLNNLAKQKLCLALGRDGCYFSSLVKIAEIISNKNIDILEAFNYCQNQMTNNQQWITSDCFVNYPDKILSYLSGKTCTITKTDDLSTDLSQYSYYIGCYKWQGSHFVVIDKDKNVIYDPLGTSYTVQNGYLASYRLVKIEN